MILDKVKNTIEQYGLIKRGESVLVGLSGGADSVCLMHALCSLREAMALTVYAAHVNHNIRGEEALSDENYAREFSGSLGAVCFVRSEQVSAYAKKRGISQELAGRELRYAFFDEIAKKYNIDKIATAHNKNDNAETIVMNFMRGSGIKGLCGIPHRRGNIIRPILDISREEIEKYCADNNLKFVTDSTNLEKIYTRNKIRLGLLPMICSEFNRNFVDVVTNNAKGLAEDSRFLEECAKRRFCEIVKDNKVNTERLLEEPFAMQSRIAYLMIKSASGSMENISSKYIEDVLSLASVGKTGKSIDLPGGIWARVEYRTLIISKKSEETADFEYKLEPGKDVFIREMNCVIRAEYADEKIDDGAVYFSAGEIGEIAVRSRRSGDVFFPAGMRGRKKLKDYFIDAKIPKNERKKTGIFTINEQIAYIIGKRRDRRFDFNGRGIKLFTEEV